VAVDGAGVPELWDTIGRHRAFITDSGELARRRSFRIREELREIVARRLEQRARELTGGSRWDELGEQVVARQVDPWSAADEMLAGVIA
jgi:LAO/AO transport system kinase